MTRAKAIEDRLVKWWTPEEDEVLRRLYPRGTVSELKAALPDRSQKSMSARAKKLGVKVEHRPNVACVVSPIIERDGVPGKACVRCLEWKPLEKFPKSKTCLGGRKTSCSRCESEHIRKTYPEVFEKAQRKYRANNPEKLYLNTMRQRARQQGAEVELITVDEIRSLKDLYGGICAYCRLRPSDTFDHVKPLSKGGTHSIANLLPACFRCNHSKRELTPEEWFASDRAHNPRRTQE